MLGLDVLVPYMFTMCSILQDEQSLQQLQPLQSLKSFKTPLQPILYYLDNHVRCNYDFPGIFQV